MSHRPESYLDMLQRNPTADLPLFDGPPADSPHQVKLDAWRNILPTLTQRQHQVLAVLARHRSDGCTLSEISRELGLGEKKHIVSGRITELKGEVRDSQGRNPVFFAGRRGGESVWKIASWVP